MIDDGILPDDIIIVRHQTYADNGDVVVALINDTNGSQLATVKRFYHQGSKIELRPKNPALHPKFYELGEVEIRGKFVGLNLGSVHKLSPETDFAACSILPNHV